MQTIKLKSKVGARGQVIIPKQIRDTFGIIRGSEVRFLTKGSNIIIAKKPAGKTEPDAINDFINAIEKRPAPERIDWDKMHYSQIEESMRQNK